MLAHLADAAIAGCTQQYGHDECDTEEEEGDQPNDKTNHERSEGGSGSGMQGVGTAPAGLSSRLAEAQLLIDL